MFIFCKCLLKWKLKKFYFFPKLKFLFFLFRQIDNLLGSICFDSWTNHLSFTFGNLQMLLQLFCIERLRVWSMVKLMLNRWFAFFVWNILHLIIVSFSSVYQKPQLNLNDAAECRLISKSFRNNNKQYRWKFTKINVVVILKTWLFFNMDR